MTEPSSVQSLRPLGAVLVRNEKGEITMKKVHVHRYVTGRVPKYAEGIYSDESDDDSDEFEKKNRKILPGLSQQRGTMAFTLPKKEIGQDQESEDELQEEGEEDDDDDVRMKIRRKKGEESSKVDDDLMKMDPRMRRLMQFNKDKDDDDDDLPPRRGRHDSSRPIVKPQVIQPGRSRQEDSDEDEPTHRDEDGDIVRRRRRHREVIDADADDDEDNTEENIERRHKLLQQKMKKFNLESQVEETFEEDEEEEDEEDEEEEYEEEDSDEDDGMPRLKPIFVPKKDRITILEKEEEERKRLENLELEKKIAAEERRRATMKIIEEERRREEEEEAKAKAQAEDEAIAVGIATVLTDDEDEETGFEIWKVRELKRIKREKEEEEERERERREIERLRNMTEEERQAELKANPRLITNKAEKGKYKFLQKYFHRGAFYLDVEDEVFKRDFAEPTLEDHFNKISLPQVMQVKNFGRAGRTKYTHLTDQDTTAFDHAWGAKDNTHAIQFHSSHGGGMKQSFERPAKRKKTA